MWLLNEHRQNKTQPTRAAPGAAGEGHKWQLKGVTTCKLAPLIAWKRHFRKDLAFSGSLQGKLWGAEPGESSGEKGCGRLVEEQ